MRRYAHLTDIPFEGRRVLVRADLNVPLASGQVMDGTRLTRLLDTLRFLKEHKAQIILLGHLGRPKGKVSPEFSLEPVARELDQLAPDLQIVFCPFFKGQEAANFIEAAGFDKTIVLENLRFDPGEEKNDPDFVRDLSSLGDCYVNDAFSVSHRSHASVVGIPAFLPAAAGFFFDAEVRALHQALETPARPLMAIVAGSKISTKLNVLQNLVEKVDVLAIGGAMAHTFLQAEGVFIGASMVEPLLFDTAREIQKQALLKGCTFLLPIDGVVAENLESGASTRVVPLTINEKNDLRPFEKIFDVGPQTVDLWTTFIKKSETLVWNGPLGVFEVSPFDAGTKQLAQVVIDQTTQGRLCSIVGGGDTLAALQKEGGSLDSFTYASSAGGAFLEWLEGKPLPGLQALQNAKKAFYLDARLR